MTMHALGADGDTAALRTVGGGNTGLSNPVSVAIDTGHQELFVSNFTVTATTGSVTVYAANADGDAAPTRTLGPSVDLFRATGLFLDLVHDELFVTTQGATPQFDTVLVYARTASGNDAPLRTLGGLATKLVSPTGIFVGDGLLFVTNRDGFSVGVFRREADGDEPPLRRIVGAATGLDQPQDVVLTRDGEMLVVNEGSSNVVVFDVGDRDNAPPRRVFTGPTGDLDGPRGLVSTRALGGATAHATTVLFAEGFESDWSGGRIGFWRAITP
jgi:hypothetical protein